MNWRQHWTDVLFLHFPVPRSELEPLLPPSLTPDEFADQAWISFVFFRLIVRPAGLPAIPGFSSLLELNVRTYVRHRDQPGIYFLRMYADNWLAIGASRLLTPLCYERAAMTDRTLPGGIRHIECRPRRPEAGALAGDCFNTGPLQEPARGSLDWWLLERYRLFVVQNDGRLLAANVEHPQWQAAPVDFVPDQIDLGRDLGLSLRTPTAAHWSPGVAARFNAFRVSAILPRAVGRPMQPAAVPADEDDAHAAALGDVDDLLLRGAAENRHAILSRGKAHHHVKRLGVDAAVGADDRKLAHRNCGELLDDPAGRIG